MKAMNAPISELGQEILATLSRYLRGQIVVMLLLAVYYAASLKALGLDYGIAVGIFTGFAVLVPYVGFGTGMLIALGLAGYQFGTDWPVLWVLCVYAAGQLLESFVLTPMLIGKSIGVNPVAVVLALMLFGSLFGFIGLLIALPASAVVVVVLRFFRVGIVKDSVDPGDRHR